MEMVSETKILIVYQVCDNCKQGIMQYDNDLAMFSHNGFPHKCDKCGYVEDYTVKYPYQRIVPIEALREPVGNEIVSK